MIQNIYNCFNLLRLSSRRLTSMPFITTLPSNINSYCLSNKLYISASSKKEDDKPQYVAFESSALIPVGKWQYIQRHLYELSFTTHCKVSMIFKSSSINKISEFDLVQGNTFISNSKKKTGLLIFDIIVQANNHFQLTSNFF